jgi:hypothetical protein
MMENMLPFSTWKLTLSTATSPPKLMRSFSTENISLLVMAFIPSAKPGPLDQVKVLRLCRAGNAIHEVSKVQL